MKELNIAAGSVESEGRRTAKKPGASKSEERRLRANEEMARRDARDGEIIA